MATKIEESREEMLECFRTCLLETDYWPEIKEWDYDKLECAYFDIGRKINKMLTDMGFKLLSFGFSTKDEIVNDPNVQAYNGGNLTSAVFCIAYDYNDADPVTIYIPFSRILLPQGVSEKDAEDMKCAIIFAMVTGFLGHYSKTHSDEHVKTTAREILAKLKITDDETINKVINQIKNHK